MMKSAGCQVIIWLFSTLLLCQAAIFGLPSLNFQHPVARIEPLMNTSIPEDAQDVQGIYVQNFMDDWFYLKFSLPAESYTTFITEFCGSEDALTAELGSEGTRWADLPDWWDMESANITLKGICLQQAYFEVYVDQSDSALYRIYIAGYP